jgi:hypothetical protein
MRALAHPGRVRMMHLLRAEALSTSELGARFGSAQNRLWSVEHGGIPRRVRERRKRGGSQTLFEVPHSLSFDYDQDGPLGMREAMNRAYFIKATKRLDAAAWPEAEDTDRDVFTTREKEPRPEDLRATAEALHEFLHRPDELAPDEPTKTSLPFTVSVRLFRVPRSASQHPDVLGAPG